MRQKCLISGGAGFIGCALSRQLINDFDSILVIDNLHPQIHPEHRRPDNLDAKVQLYIGDVTVASDWDRLLADYKPDVVIHLAAETGTGQSLAESYRHANVNTVGTAQMLDAFVRNKAIPKRLLLASSRAIYGEGIWKSRKTGETYYPGLRTDKQLSKKQWDFPDSEYVPACACRNVPSPTSIYGATKLAQENIIRSWCSAFDAQYSIVRLQNVYGPGQSLINPYTGIVSLFIKLAKEGKSIPLYEDGLMLRDFILIHDVAVALQRVLLIMPGEILDIGTGTANTIADMSQIITKRYGAPPPHVCEKYRNGDVRHAMCNIQRTREVLKWEPEYSLEQGITILSNWIDSQSGE